MTVLHIGHIPRIRRIICHHIRAPLLQTYVDKNLRGSFEYPPVVQSTPSIPINEFIIDMDDGSYRVVEVDDWTRLQEN